MNHLSNNDRLVLLAIQGSEWGKSTIAIRYATELSNASILKAVKRLSGLQLIRAVEVDGTSRYYPVDLARLPLFPNVKAWLGIYLRHSRLHPKDDSLDEAVIAIEQILVAAIVTASRDVEYLTHLLDLPPDFVFLVIELAERIDLWQSIDAFELERVIRDCPSDPDSITPSLNSLYEQFIDIAWTPQIETYLCKLIRGESIDDLAPLRACDAIESRWMM